MTREEREIQREIDFTDWWLREHKMEGLPTYADAIAWADRTMIERVLNFIFEHFWEHPHVSGHICTDSFESLEQMEEELIKAMEE